jgi:tartrate/fumarate subfamily iron-sulfur-dependent hydro-lyase beta chain
MIKLKTPLSHEDVMKLKTGDNVLISGTIFTGRDRAHVFFLENDFRKIKDSVIYHCGPIVKGKEVIAAGPTTSSRMNAYTPKLITKYGIKAIIGKGGMDGNVREALKGNAVYFSAIGGAAVLYADRMEVKGVERLDEFGMPEAIWEFKVNDFPVTVTMDAHGNSVYDKVKNESEQAARRILK